MVSITNVMEHNNHKNHFRMFKNTSFVIVIEPRSKNSKNDTAMNWIKKFRLEN